MATVRLHLSRWSRPAWVTRKSKRSTSYRRLFSLLVLFAAANGCGRETGPSFKLAWSEYPSWSTFGVANELGLLDGAAGSLGTIEKKWHVDVVLNEVDYDASIVMYGSGHVDAVTITNMDILNPSLSRSSVAILPTSMSNGADALIVTSNIGSIQELRGRKVYGLSKSVSEYVFARNLAQSGEKEADYLFTNMDPSAAALAMQQRRRGFDAIVVWNPFLLETLNKRRDTRVLFDSARIPGEILDLVVVSETALERPGGHAFAKALADTYYAINRRLNSPETRNDTLVALGQKFSHLDVKSMEIALQQTKFFGPSEGLTVFTDGKIEGLMDGVVDFCVRREIVPRAPTIGYGPRSDARPVALRFDPTYMQGVIRDSSQ